MRSVNILFSAVFFVFSALIFIATFFFKQTLITDQFIGAAFFPRLVAVVMACLSLALLGQQFAGTARSDKSRLGDVFTGVMAKPAAAALLVAVYIVLLNLLGFFVSTCALFAGLLALLGNRKISFFFVAPLFTGIIEFIFVILFKVQLPVGFVGF